MIQKVTGLAALLKEAPSLVDVSGLCLWMASRCVWVQRYVFTGVGQSMSGEVTHVDQNLREATLGQGGVRVRQGREAESDCGFSAHLSLSGRRSSTSAYSVQVQGCRV